MILCKETKVDNQTALQQILARLKLTLDHSIKEGDDCVYPHFTTSELKEQLALLHRDCDKCGNPVQWAEICTGCIKARTIEQYIKQYLAAFQIDLTELISAAVTYLGMFSPHEDSQERARLRAAAARLTEGATDD